MTKYILEDHIMHNLSRVWCINVTIRSYDFFKGVIGINTKQSIPSVPNLIHRKQAIKQKEKIKI